MRWHSDPAFDMQSCTPALAEFRDACVNLIAGRGYQRHFGLAGAEGDLKRMREAARSQADAGSRELQSVQQKCELGGAAQALFDACAFVLRHKFHHLLDRTREALRRRARIRMMHQPRAQIAGVGEVASVELFTSLVEFKELPLRCVFVEPGHARERKRCRTARHNHPQPLIQTASASLLTAMMQPQDAERENAIDDCCVFVRTNADDSPRL